jgi:hypothetical protein
MCLDDKQGYRTEEGKLGRTIFVDCLVVECEDCYCTGSCGGYKDYHKISKILESDNKIEGLKDCFVTGFEKDSAECKDCEFGKPCLVGYKLKSKLGGN